MITEAQPRIQPNRPRYTLSDLDGTLINNRYQFTSPSIRDTVTAVQQNDVLVGLSSDTPYKALEQWHERMGMNGPIIAEKGAVLAYGTGLVYDKNVSASFLQSREGIERKLAMDGFVLWYGNPVEAIRQGESIGSPGEKVGLINDLRISSVGVFFRRVDAHGKLIIDNQTTEEGMSDIQALYPEFEVDEDYNTKHGLIIVSKRGVNKRYGTKLLMQHEETDRIDMIGDSDADYVGTDIADHYAVANATSFLKEKAVYIANQPITEGSEEILRKIGNLG